MRSRLPPLADFHSPRPDDEDPLARVAVGMRLIEDVKQIAPLDVRGDILESDAAVRPEPRVLRVVPGEELHSEQTTKLCAHWAHIGVERTVPKTVPRRPQRGTIQDQRERFDV